MSTQLPSTSTRSALWDHAQNAKRAPNALPHLAPRAAPPPFDQISAEAAAAVFPRWQEPCEAVFEVLASRFPADLARLILSKKLEDHDLTFAAEALGAISDSDLVRDTLVPLLGGASGVVREGAIYGLQRHLNDDVRARLVEIAASDPSRALRTVAKDALEPP